MQRELESSHTKYTNRMSAVFFPRVLAYWSLWLLYFCTLLERFQLVSAAPATVIPLANFTDTQGTIFQGANDNHETGFSVYTAGDFNGDNITDFMIGSRYGSYSGTYGGIVYLFYGGKNLLAEMDLAAYLRVSDFDNTNDELIYQIISQEHVYFQNAGVNVTTFTQDDITSQGTIAIVHDGTNANVNYTFTFSDGLYISPVQLGRVTLDLGMGNAPPVLLNNDITISEAQSLVLRPTDLSATDAEDDDAALIFSIFDLTHGQFKRVSEPGVGITSFTQQEITDSEIAFVHDGSELAPSYSVIVSDGETPSDPAVATINFSADNNDAPVLVINALIVDEGQRIVLTPSQLSATDNDASDATLTFSVYNVLHGQFERADTPSVVITTFTQQDITDEEIVFQHDGSELAPEYLVSVSDGVAQTTPAAAAITFNANQHDAPVLLSNGLTVGEGKQVVITSTHLSAIDADTASADLVFSIYDAEHGQFEALSAPGVAIIEFTQAQVASGEIVFVHDGSESAPSYSVSVSDGTTQTMPVLADIDFNADVNDAPEIRLGEWVVEAGQRIMLTTDLIAAIDNDNSPAELIYQIRDIQHGAFYRRGNDSPLLLFSQADINAGEIDFEHDGSDVPPVVTLIVNDGQASSAAQSVNFRFIPRAAQQVRGAFGENTTTYTSLIVAGGFVCCIGLMGGSVYTYRNRKAKQSRLGDEHLIPREVYEMLKVKGAGNFKSAQGIQFVEQINHLVETYEKRYGNIDTDKSEYAKHLGKGIIQSCNLVRDRLKQTSLVLTEDENAATLRVNAQTIVEQTHRYVTEGTMSLRTLDTNTMPDSAASTTELTLFPSKSPRKSQRSPRQNNDSEHHKRRSRSGSQSVHAGRSRAESRRSRHVSVSMK